MRRKEKEISDESGVDAIIANATVCRLGMVNGDKPYIVPLSFGYQDQALYFHGALNWWENVMRWVSSWASTPVNNLSSPKIKSTPRR